MKLCELPRLKAALDMLGMDNGADVVSEAVIPVKWEMRARLAEDELLRLRPEQVVDLVVGEHTDQQKVVQFAQNADRLLAAAFDDDLSAVVFKAWTGIYDARAAELRYQR